MPQQVFRLQYLSDIHLEFHDKKNLGRISSEMFVKPVADYLALCGDIGMPERPGMLTFLKFCSENFKEVYWIPGNHEFYNYGQKKKATVQEKLELCERICDGFKNIHFMNRTVRQVPGWNLRIAGCTMWTEIRPEDDMKVIMSMNDVRQIYKSADTRIYPEDIREWHTRDKAWLDGEIARALTAQEDMIVLTHHLPSHKLIHPKYEGHPLNFCFAANLEQLVRVPVRGWLCGHSHTACEIQINGITCALNPRGYPGEDDTGFSREKVLEITCDYDESACDSCDSGDAECDDSSCDAR